MKSSRPKMAAGVFLAAVALTAFGCGGAAVDQDKKLVDTDGGGTQQVMGTAGEGTGGSTGGTTGGQESGLSPALIMSIVN